MKTLEELKQEMDAAFADAHAARDAWDAADLASDAYITAVDTYLKKLKETQDE